MCIVGPLSMPMSSKTEVRFWYPDRQYLAHKDEFDAEMQRVLTAGDLILRQDGEQFEDNLARFLGVKHVVACASGTDALLLSLKALRIGQMDQVLVPSYTFRATLEAVHHAGARPVLYDLDEDPTTLVGHRTAAIILAHLEGRVQEDTERIAEFCRKHGITLIEDTCQAIGAAPLQGVLAAYSFYPAKILGCFGDGGAIATNDLELAKHLRKMRNHYKDDWATGYGYNSRLDNLQAAVLNIKLKYLPHALKRRKEIAERYDGELLNVGLPTVRQVYQDYVIITPEPKKMRDHLAGQGVQSLENTYPFPGGNKGQNAMRYEAQTLRIPCTPEHTDEEIGHVIDAINSYGK